MFVGPSKPKEPEDFFSEFINQLDDLVTNGFDCELYGKKEIKCKVLIAHTPGRQLGTCTAGHTANRGCNFFEQIKITLNHRVVYSDTEKTPRTDDVLYFL